MVTSGGSFFVQHVGKPYIRGNKMGNLFKRYDILIALALFMLAIPAEKAEFFSLLEDQTLSFRQMMRWQHGDKEAMKFSDNIFMVNTDEAFFQEYKGFPFRRDDIGDLVKKISAAGAKVIALDVLMDFPSSYGDDKVLAKNLDDAGNTLLVSQAQIEEGKFIRLNHPTPELDKVSTSAYTNISSSSSIVTSLSRLKVYPEIAKERNGWPFAVTAVAMYLGVEPKLEGNILKIGDNIAFPLDEFSTFYIDFPEMIGGAKFLNEFKGMSAIELLELDMEDEEELEEYRFLMEDKIVILGDTSEVSHDWFDTPVGMVYGVEIIADTINTILKNAPLRPASGTSEAVMILIYMTIIVGVAFLKSPTIRTLLYIAAISAFILICTLLYIHQGTIYSMSYVLVAAIISSTLVEIRYFQEERNQKKQMSKTFGQYIPAELVDEMNKTGQSVGVGGESKEMTVLFSDVRGFTTISESVEPNELTQLMNGFLTPMTHVIHERRGTIDKYMGDAIMAFWGAPLDDPEHAKHAVLAGLDMITAMTDLRKEFKARGWPEIKIGVGCNSGTMNVGNMGSEFRLAYTVLGDAVNLGSRLEGLTKQYGVQFIISEYTQAEAPEILCRELDKVRVKGKDVPVTIVEPLGLEENIDAATKTAVDDYHKALALYREQKWDEAAAGFETLKAADPDRMIYQIYLDRIGVFRSDPPGDQWDGVFTHTSK